jgi:hypothetical protein
MRAVKWAQPRWRPKRSLTSRVKPRAMESPTSCWSGGSASGQMVYGCDAISLRTWVTTRSGCRTRSPSRMSWITGGGSAPNHFELSAGRSSTSVAVTSSSLGPACAISTRMVRT